MKEIIIKEAILYPHLHPWKERLKKYNITIDVKELDQLLSEERINEELVRRKIGWIIEVLVYSNAAKSNNLEEMIKNIYEEYLKVCDDLAVPPISVFKAIMLRKDFNSNERLELYKKIINGNYEDYEQDKTQKIIEYWLIDLYIYYFISLSGEEELPIDMMGKFILDNLQGVLNIDDSVSEFVTKRIAQSGFNRKWIVRDCRSVLVRRNHLIKETLKHNLISSKSEEIREKDMFEETDKILDDLMEMVGEIKDTVESKDEKFDKGIEEGSSVNITEKDNNADILSKTLRELIEEQGYQLVKEKKADDSNLNRFIKSLVDPGEGAVLSQLYQIYKNIETADISNVQAALGDFFNHLMVSGLIPLNEGMSMGEEIEAKSSELLKKYRTTVPVERDVFKAVVKYPAWELDGKVVMQPVLIPKKRRKE